MTAKVGPLDYAEGWQLAAELGDVVRARQADVEAVERQFKALQAASRNAHDELSAVLGPWRELVVALTDGAGNSGKHPLGPAVQAAREALGPPEGWAVGPPEELLAPRLANTPKGAKVVGMEATATTATKTRTWACNGWMAACTVTTTGGNRKEAKRQAVAQATAQLPYTGRVTATLLTES